MALLKMLPGIPTLWPILPTQLRSLRLFWHARAILQGAKPDLDLAARLAKDGLEILHDAEKSSGRGFEPLLPFAELEPALTALVATAGYPMDPDSKGPSLFLAEMISHTAPALLGRGRSLRDGNEEARAFESFLQAVSLGLITADRMTAEEAIECALDMSPEHAAVLHLRGFLRWEAAQYDAAARDFEAVIRSTPSYDRARIALADAYLKLGAVNAAAKTLEDVSRDEPQSECLIDVLLRAEAHRLSGLAAAAQNDHALAEQRWEFARSNLNDVLVKKPDFTDAVRSRALVWYSLGDFESALEDLKESLRLAPDHAAAHGWMAAVLLDQEEYAKALASVNVSLALLGSEPSSSALRPWLLGLRGRALTATEWTDQAIEALSEVVALCPQDEEAARQLIEVLGRKRDGAILAERARALQENGYSNEFLGFLRMEEVNARRALGQHEASFAALGREPLPAVSAESIWLHARMLADVGNFEAARDLFRNHGDISKRDVKSLSLQGWVVQNLEPANAEARLKLASEGVELYRQALGLLNGRPEEALDEVWIRKGLANALLRAGRVEEAGENYRMVIVECERQMRRSKHSARALALIGWCHHCRAEYPLALRYYRSAGSGEETIAGSFDYALVLFASTYPASSDEDTVAFEQYRATFVRALKQTPRLRRIGLCRVALHDLREWLFRFPDQRGGARIVELLCNQLMEDVAGIDAEEDYGALADNVYAFLNLVKAYPPVGAETRGSDRKEGAPEDRKEDAGSPIPDRNAAFTYADASDLQRAQSAARTALKSGLYREDPTGARSLIALVTRNAARGIGTVGEYEATIFDAYSPVGSGRAYLDLPKTVKGLSREEQALLIGTILKLFQYSQDRHVQERDWLYVGDSGGRMAVPYTDALVKVLRPYVRIDPAWLGV